MLKRPLRSLLEVQWRREGKPDEKVDDSGKAVKVDPLSSYQFVVFTAIDIAQSAGRSDLIQIHDNMNFYKIRNFVVRELCQLGTL